MKKFICVMIESGLWLYATILALIGIVLYLDAYNPDILNRFFYEIFGK